MRLLTVPNWSFGPDPDLHRAFGKVLFAAPVTVHYFKGDVDHNRTVTAFSGEGSLLVDTLEKLCEAAFPYLDLSAHEGVHPRIGALDVCPFVLPPATPEVALPEAMAVADSWAERLATRFDVPIYLYERSERGRHAADLPTLRRGGFAALADRDLEPDFGPSRANRRLGVSVVGVRDWLIAMNVNLATGDAEIARMIAAGVRRMRTEGDARFTGVRSLGFYLATRNLAQVSLNFTMPDVTHVDPVVHWVGQQARAAGTSVLETELIGVIRAQDLPTALTLTVAPEQIVSAE